ncbi:MAG: M20/M25/M40 family metallo-hydrolase [Deltaproteobacteria bacterium]|jgi:succinyl-diaminopimelate desuccinylase|nr:M20/M25/M40 family metallo-hydrolase [Deltaproteobacteria bacterium]
MARILVLLLICLLPRPAPAGPLSLPRGLPEQPGMADLQTVLLDLAGRRMDIIAIQRELVSRPALGPEAGGRGEEDKANWLTAYLTEKGVPLVERQDFLGRVHSMESDAARDVRPNIIALHPGRYGLEQGRTLWLVCHLHVAHPGPQELWNGSPWKLRAEGNTIYGRGVMDNYQSITASVLLLESLRRNRLTPALNLGLVLHAQNAGFRHVLQSRPDLFKADDLYLVPDFGSPDGMAASLAEKGFIWLKLTIRGEGRHAAEGRDGHSALAAGSALIARLRDFGRDFSGPASGQDGLFADPVPACSATQAATNPGGINSVATSYTLHLDCRFPPSYEAAALEHGVRDLARRADMEHGVSTELAVLAHSAALPPTPEDSDIVLALRRAVRAQFPGKGNLAVQGSNTYSTASLLRAKGLPAAAWAKISPARRHTANEFAHISDHLDESGVFARILFDREIKPRAAAKP